MKFLCEHCKAKYQIADEKVAGRTVRMKCRKCGNAIEVRAAVTETSVNSKLPTTDPPPAHAPAGGAPRPGRTLATSLSAAPKPAPARPAAPRSPEGGNLASAFHRNVQQKEEEISVALDMRELSAADEWYVAINGVPVGPIRVAELRRKAAIGVVNEDSLCWQEGMEEWRPVKAVAELAALVREAAVGGRVSLVTPPPPDARSVFSPPPRPPSMRPAAPAAPRAPRPAAPPAPSAWSNVVPITSRLATAERLHEEPAKVDAIPHGMVAPDPFAAPAPAPIQPMPIVGVGAGDPASSPFPLTTAPYRTSEAASSAAPRMERRPLPIIPIAMFVLAAAFGVTAATILIKPAAAPPAATQVPAAANPPPQTAPPPSTAAAAPTDSTVAPAPTTNAVPGKVAAAPTRTGSAPGGKSPGPTAATDPSLRDLIAGAANGPNAGPSPGPAGGGGAELTADQVQSVLQSHQVGLKRTCWDRVSTQSPTVNEMLHVVVGPSGQVSSATATGNDPVVGHCIEGEVKRWSFPGSGEINIPFHFLRQ